MIDLEDRWLSVDEMSKYLGVSNDTVYRWIDRHNMPAHRMGRLWKFKKDEVDEWVKAGGAASDHSKTDESQESEVMKHMERKRTGMQPKRKVYAVDLFCGAGGLTNGLEKAGIDVRLGVDVDPACEFPYTANNKAKFLLKSVEDLEPRDIEKGFRKNGIRLLAGCAPCQTFSTYNQKATSADRTMVASSAVLQARQGNLTPFGHHGKRSQGSWYETFSRNSSESLEGARYHVTYGIVNCVDYGVPQQRQRLVLLASRLGPIRLLSPSEFGAERLTVRDSIGDLPPLEAGEMNEADPLHQASALSRYQHVTDQGIAPRWDMAGLERNTGRRLSQEENWQDVSERLWPHVLGRTGSHHHDPILRIRERSFRPSGTEPGDLAARRRDPPEFSKRLRVHSSGSTDLQETGGKTDWQRRSGPSSERSSV